MQRERVCVCAWVVLWGLAREGWGAGSKQGPPWKPCSNFHSLCPLPSCDGLWLSHQTWLFPQTSGDSITGLCPSGCRSPVPSRQPLLGLDLPPPTPTYKATELVAQLAHRSSHLFPSKGLFFPLWSFWSWHKTPGLWWDFDLSNRIRQRETVTYAEKPFRLALGLDV